MILDDQLRARNTRILTRNADIFINVMKIIKKY